MVAPKNTVGHVIVKEESPELSQSPSHSLRTMSDEAIAEATAPPSIPTAAGQAHPRVVKRRRAKPVRQAHRPTTFRTVPELRFGQSVGQKTEQYLTYIKKVKQVCDERTPPLNPDLQCVIDNVDRSVLLLSAWKHTRVRLEKEAAEVDCQTRDLSLAIHQAGEDSDEKDLMIADLEDRVRKLEDERKKR